MNNQVLKRRTERGWQSGLSSLLKREFRWWGTRSGLFQFGVWIFFINGLFALVFAAAGIEQAGEAFQIMFGIMPIFSALGILVIAQGTIIRERQSGTAAWVLSAPVSRSAFFLSKLIPLALGNLTAMLIIPGLIGYLQLSVLLGAPPPAIPYFYGLSLTFVHLLFYLTLALLGGTVLNTRAGVAGIGLIMLFGGSFLIGFVPETVAALTPWPLGVLAGIVAQGQPIPSLIPVITTVIYSIVFIAVGIWRFGREEF
ncbi:MAG: ABC transporter permease subunit [Nitrososphaerales archaeon]